MRTQGIVTNLNENYNTQKTLKTRGKLRTQDIITNLNENQNTPKTLKNKHREKTINSEYSYKFKRELKQKTTSKIREEN